MRTYSKKIIQYEDAQNMNDDKSIHIKLELTKNPQEKTLTLTVHLNPNAPNIITHEDHISWTFTREEQDFLYDAITILRNKKPFPTPAPHKTTPTTYPPQTTDDAINEAIQKHTTANHQYSSDTQETIDAIIKAKSNQL